jgi:multidrug efflux system membrane fusion protein
MRKDRIAICLAVTAPLVLLLYVSCSRDKAAGPAAGKPPSAGAAKGSFEAPPVPVEIQVVQIRQVDYALTAVGSLQAKEIIRVPARVAGVIQNVAFQEGEWVTPDKVLARIDPERYRLAAQRVEADFNQAQAKAREAQAALDKRKVLQAKDPGWVTAEELSNVQAQLDADLAAAASAKAAWELAKKDLRDSAVRAETPGFIDQKLADTGQYLTAGTPVANMVDSRKLKLSFKVAESEAARLGADPKITFRVKAIPGKDFSAKIFHIADTADPGTRMVGVLGWVDNPNRELRPGFFADVKLDLEAHKGSLVVPQTAVLPTDQGFVGYVLKDRNRVEKRTLRLGLFTKEGDVEVLEGLRAGDKLITRGASVLTEDSVVDPQPPEATQ